jgi:hypothetical protein
MESFPPTGIGPDRRDSWPATGPRRIARYSTSGKAPHRSNSAPVINEVSVFEQEGIAHASAGQLDGRLPRVLRMRGDVFGLTARSNADRPRSPQAPARDAPSTGAGRHQRLRRWTVHQRGDAAGRIPIGRTASSGLARIHGWSRPPRAAPDRTAEQPERVRPRGLRSAAATGAALCQAADIPAACPAADAGARRGGAPIPSHDDAAARGGTRHAPASISGIWCGPASGPPQPWRTIAAAPWIHYPAPHRQLSPRPMADHANPRTPREWFFR